MIRHHVRGTAVVVIIAVRPINLRVLVGLRTARPCARSFLCIVMHQNDSLRGMVCKTCSLSVHRREGLQVVLTGCVPAQILRCSLVIKHGNCFYFYIWLFLARVFIFIFDINVTSCRPSTTAQQLGMLAYQVENNDSQMMGIKKKEYLRVLSDIVKESQQAQVRFLLHFWGGGTRYKELTSCHFRVVKGKW